MIDGDPVLVAASIGVADGSTSGVHFVNGVFKGGGAKGIAYAGALRAVRDRGLWFKSVAGASAGAVTAALIAAGMGPEEVEVAVPHALASAKAPLPQRVGSAVIGRRSSIFDSGGIRDWLDGTLRERIHKTGEGPVTFGELFAATGIALYVVAMDLATGVPMVLCHHVTPAVDVAGAVAASSAIPGAFPAGRGVFNSTASGATVHALVDGGTWANYPSFVFQDRSFRTWLRAASEARQHWSDADDQLWDDECARAVVGFVLGRPEPLEDRTIAAMVPTRGPVVSPRFDRGPTYTSANRSLYLINLLLSNAFVRLMLVVAMATWVIVTLLASSIMARRLSTWLAGWVPEWLFPFALVGMMSMVAMAATVAIGLVVSLVLVGRLIGDTLIPSMKALIGVPTGVAPWIGFGNDSVVLEVPCDGLATTDFAVGIETRTRAVQAAHASVSAQLDDPRIEARLQALVDGSSPPEEHPLLDPTVTSPPPEPDRLTVFGAIGVVVATTIIGGLAWSGVTLADAGEVRSIVVSLLAGVIVGGAAMIFLGGRAAERSSARSRFGVRPADRRSSVTTVVTAVAGLALLAGAAALSAVAMEERASDTKLATVVSGDNLGTDLDHDGIPDAEYAVAVSGRSDPVTIVSDRRLRIDEHVFVDVDGTDGSATLVGALDDRRFPVSIVMGILGLGLLVSARRRHVWERRCRRLAALAAGLEPFGRTGNLGETGSA
jgi:predicted acylesterase/phospholipase RssA